MSVVVNNPSSSDVFVQDIGANIPANSSREFSSVYDITESADMMLLISAGTLYTDAYVGANVFLLHKDSDFGSVSADEWKVRPFNEIVTFPHGVASLSDNTFTLCRGIWAASISCAGDGRLRLYDVVNESVLAESCDYETMHLDALITVPNTGIFEIHHYPESNDIVAPDDDGSGVYTFAAARFECVGIP